MVVVQYMLRIEFKILFESLTHTRPKAARCYKRKWKCVHRMRIQNFLAQQLCVQIQIRFQIDELHKMH